MGKFEKKMEGQEKRKRGAQAVCIAAVAVILVVAGIVFAGFGRKTDEPTVPTEQTQPAQQETLPTQEAETNTPETDETEAPARRELTVDSVVRQGETMIVTTSYATVKYPFAFSDLLSVVPVNQTDRAVLEFYAVIDGGEYLLFSISFDGGEGILLGYLTPEGEQQAMPVWGTIQAADPEMDANGARTFYAAQEMFNDVVSSLEENPGFVPAD